MSSRPSVVYVPGWGCDADIYTEAIEALAPEAEQSVVDLGEGSSFDQMVAATIEQLPERCALVGASMGGWVAQQVAAEVPERIERLVLACTWASPLPAFASALEISIDLVGGGAWGEELRPALLANFSQELQEGPLPDRLLAMLDRVGRDRLLAQARAMLAHPDVTSSHAGIAAPTLVLAADDDVFFPVQVTRAIATSLVGLDKVTVGFEVAPGSNHNMSWERPEVFTAAVRRWCLGPDPTGVAPSGT